MSLRRILLCCAAILVLACSCALADVPGLRGYERSLEPQYVYVSFGSYPYTKEGAVQPVVWRVLGHGVPGDTDVIDSHNAPNRKDPKHAIMDEQTDENEDVYCLITEYIIDMVFYHDVRDTVDNPGLDYENTLMYGTLNGEVLNRLFTPLEQTVLVEMPERGLLGLPSRKGELFREDYGFVEEDFVEFPRRATTGTPYAFSQGLKRIKGRSWYWTTDWRAPGRRWIVGDNGHISVSGVDREGGIRPIIYVRTDMLECIGGTGTLEDPFQLAVIQP